MKLVNSKQFFNELMFKNKKKKGKQKYNKIY